MKKILIVLLLLPVTKAFSQLAVVPAIEIKADTATYQTIDDKYWELLEDPTGKLTISQLSTEPLTSRFHGNTTRAKGYNYHINTYWLRYRFKNVLSHPVKITIPEHAAYAWLYTLKTNGKWQTQTNGTMVPWSQRDGLKRLAQFVVLLEPGKEITFYEKDVFNFTFYKPQVFSFTIGYADHVIDKWYVNNDSFYYSSLTYSFILGILLLASIINLFFYSIVREKAYLFFAFFILFFGLVDFVENTNVTVLREHPYTNLFLDFFFVMALFFTIMHFIRHFLSTKARTPGWDKFLVVLSYGQLGAWVVIATIPPGISHRAHLIIDISAHLLTYGYLFIILATLVYYSFKNTGSARVGILAALPGFLWWCLGFGFLYVCGILNRFFNVPYSNFYFWISTWSNVIQLVCFIWIVIVFSWILFGRFRDMQKMLVQTMLEKERIAKEKEIERGQLIQRQNELLEEEVQARTAELRQSIEYLKSAQAQLIQSEKMASLGELTAGIAHEIQNPLNFVNNFSEVNKELLEELKAESEKPKAEKDDQLELELINDLIENEGKINHHGKRADAIVKGMLEHSRAGSGIKEPTDLNKLADEYLRLSYHGLRSKDKSFNAGLLTHFDEKLPQINLIPQDIGRVMLNLFNNAFYAVNEKKRTASEDYKPEVCVETFYLPLQGVGGLKVKDNGTGIPDAIKEKIMQPFFTTKPTGEGTGLGLSLSYDMVVKGHGGSIQVDSIEGEGSEFKVILPV